MSELQFPKDPIVGQEYDFAPYKYYWDGVKWKTKGIGYNPVNALQDELEPRVSNNESKVFEALKRSYAAAGLNLVEGSFEEGGVLLAANDVMITASGVGYSWKGSEFPHNVAKGTNPAVPSSGYVPCTSVGSGSGTDALLRSDLASDAGMSLIGLFSDVSSLRLATGLTPGHKIQLLGYYSDTPGIGGGTLIITSDTTSADNGGTIFVTADGVRVKRPHQASYNLSDFGAKAGVDSTSSIVAASRSGLNINVDVNTKIIDRGLFLTLGQVWRGAGGSIRQECVLVSPKPANTASYVPSSTPLFSLSGNSELNGVTGYPAFESVHMAGASKVKSCKFFGEGRTWYDGINCYASNCEIVGNEIYDHGQWLSGVTYAARGDGILVSNGASFVQRIRIHNNKCQGNAKNGLMIIGAKMVTATGNEITANRMSAIQIAFLAGLKSNNASGITITGNLCEFNGADCFDCNNNSGNPLTDTMVNVIIAHNQFRSNGWLYATRAEQLSRTGTKLETPDGGACTLVNVGRVNFIDNEIYDNARVCLYMINTMSCVISGNRYYKETSHSLDDTDGFRVVNSTYCTISNNKARMPKIAYRIEGDCTGTEFYGNQTVTTEENAHGIVAVTGVTGFKFFKNKVQITSGKFIYNPTFEHSDCEFIATVNGTVSYGGVANFVLKSNSYSFPEGYILFSGMMRLTLDGFKVTTSTSSENGAVRVVNLSGICRMRDLNIIQGGSTAGLLLDGGNFTLYLRDGRIANNASGNNLRVQNANTSMVIRTAGIDLTTGFPDVTGATWQQITWA